MAIKQPIINITFEQLGDTVMTRGEQGIGVLIVKDDTDKSFNLVKYSTAAAALNDQSKYTADNYAAITDFLSYAPATAWVYRMDMDGSLDETLSKIAGQIKSGWITIADMETSEGTALVSWIKQREAESKGYKAIVYNQTPAPDCMHVVNFATPSVTFTDARGKQGGVKFLPSLLGMLAKRSIAPTAQGAICTNLSIAEEVSDADAAAASGKLVLLNSEDGDVTLGVAINSLTTYNGSTRVEDMSYVEIVEAMDLMREDIARTFRKYYRHGPNTRDRQMDFIAAINGNYFKQLENQEILNPNGDNIAEIDIAAQRAAWVASGKSEAADWDDDKVKAMPFKRSVFLTANVNMVNVAYDLIFPIFM